MKCVNCNHEFPKGNFCPKCGTKVVKEEPVIEAAAPMTPPAPPVPPTPQTPPQAPAAVNNTVFTNTFTPQPEEENPYEDNYYTPPQAPVNQAQYQPVQQIIQPAPQPQYQQPYYPPQNPPKKGWTAGKIVALVAGVLVGLIIFSAVSQIVVPLGLMACYMSGENSPTAKNIDKTPHAISEVVQSGDFEYSMSELNYTDTFNNVKRTDGSIYLTIKATAKNITDHSSYDNATYALYADDVLCKEYEPDTDDSFYQDNEISPGKLSQTELVFIIPANATTLSIEVNTTDLSGFLEEESRQFTYTIK